MEALIVVGDALENFERVLHARLVDDDGLEAALERGVLLDMLAVLVEGRRADDLNLAARERRLENVGGVHAALGVARADDVVYLVDHEDDVAELADLLDQALHAAFKLAAELRPGDERRQVEEVDFLVAQLEGHLARDDALGQPLGDGRLADARLADEAGIVLLAAVEDLNDALDLLGAADDGVELAVAGALGEVDAVVVEILFLLIGLALARVAGLAARGAALLGLFHGGAAAEQAVEERERRGLAALLVVLAVALGQVAHLLGAAEGLHHLVVQSLEIVRADAHALHHVLHLRQPELRRTLEAEALIDRLVLLIRTGDEHHGHILLASGTKSRLHSFPPLTNRDFYRIRDRKSSPAGCARRKSAAVGTAPPSPG